MKRLVALLSAFLVLLLPMSGLHAETWQPSAGHTQMAIWPGAAPDQPVFPAGEYLKVERDHPVAGKPYLYVGNVARPTITVYPPEGRNTGAAVVVIPGGGFEILAIDLEGTEVCDWLTSRGITCVLLKYRVPSTPYDWRCNCRKDNHAISVPSLEDTQRAVRLVRFHAPEWKINAHKIGVLGFSAGGYLVAEASTDYKLHLYAAVDEADRQSSRPDFAVALYPGHLVTDNGLNKNVPVTPETPPTFLLQAEDDHVDGVAQVLTYYEALRKDGVPAELHVYAKGGHAFGLRPTADPISHWPALVETWLSTIGMTIP